MDNDKIQSTHDSLREAVDEFSEHKGHDLLTDPEAVAAAEQKVAGELAVTPGDKLRKAREAMGFSLAELAEKSGLEADLLAQMEQGQTVLPLGQIIKLSKTLSLKMSDMISAGDKSFTIVRSDERHAYSRFGEARRAKYGYEYQSLAPGKKDRMMEPFIVTLLPAAADEPSSHDGQEFIYVLEGEMEVWVDDTRDVLKPGDSVYYDSSSTHLVKAHGDKPARILAVMIS